METPLTSLGSALPNAFEGVTQSLANRPSPLNGQPAGGDAREAAESFEAFFISQMLSDMFAGVETDPLFGGGPGETVFRSLMIDEYGKSLASTGGVGIANSVLGEIIRLQETDQ
ncbi:MAG: chemotactic signal-response protein chel [Alphaproteobacteria bacterium]|nr:chemotactic signal-response protein chel [Alphaproteobacteria bacterium]